MADILEAARRWYAQGFVPMAVARKRPIVKRWESRDAAEHLEIIEERKPPQIGLRMGTQQDGRVLICIDVDNPEAFELAQQQLGELPPTWTQRTGSGGHHYVYLWPGELEAPTTGTGSLPKGVDVRCERGHIVAAPSIHHEHGKPYELVHDVPPVPLPRAWADELEPREEAAEPLPLPPLRDPSRQLQDCLNYTARMQPAISGSGGHKATFDVALKCVEFALNEGDALYVMKVYNQRCQPPWTEKALQHKVKQAYTRGKVKPGTKGSMAREPLPERQHAGNRLGNARGTSGEVPSAQSRKEPVARAAASADVGLHSVRGEAGNATQPQAKPQVAEAGKVRSEPKRNPSAAAAPEGVETDWCSPDIETWWLPKPIQDWVVAVSECAQVPALMPLMAALCTLATVCQGRSSVKFCAADPEPLSLYWFLFSATGSRKSSVMGKATKPLREYLRKLREECEPERRAAERKLAQLQNEEKRLLRSKAGKFTPEGQAIKNELAAIAHEIDTLVMPAVPMTLISDINPHMLPAVLKQNLEADGIAAAAALDAEGTIAANMLGRHTGHVHVDTLLKASMGEPIELVRASKVSDALFSAVLPHAHLTLGVMAQLHYIDKFREHPELSDTGFIGRCIFSSLPNIRDIQGDEQEVPERITLAYAACVQRLAEADLPELVDLRQSAPWALWRDTLPDLGAPGWRARILGRIARIAALCDLAERFGTEPGLRVEASSVTVTESSTVTLSHGQGGVHAPHEGIKRIAYLYEYYITKDIQGIQILERPSTLRSVLATRLGVWLRDSVTVGQCISLRDVMRRLHASKLQALEACDELLAAGFLSQAGETRRQNRTVSVQYRVEKLPAGAEAPKRRRSAAWVDEAGPDPENDGR